MDGIHYAEGSRDFGNHKIDQVQIRSGDGLSFSFETIAFKAAGETVISCSPHSVNLLFVFKATDDTYIESGNGEKLLFEGRQYNAFNACPQSLCIKWDKKGVVKLAWMSISVSFLERFLPDLVFAGLKPYVTGPSPAAIFRNFTPFSSGLLDSLAAVPANRILFTKLGPSYLKVKAEEALVTFLQDFEKGGEKLNTLPGEYLSGRYKMKMHQVRDIILARLNDPPTLHEMARMVETNECYLKEHFKKIFGLTIFQYRRKVLMERSLRMLRESDAKITEIANLAGYKHATHFCAAFKKYYGFSPRSNEGREKE